MTSLAVAAVVFVCAFGGAMLGSFLRARLPEHHLNSESRDVVKLGTGLIATLSALVLGLLIASAKSGFDQQRTGFQQIGSNFVVLDRALARYGPESKAARDALRRTVVSMLDRLWPDDNSSASRLDAAEITAAGAAMYGAIRDLAPGNDAQKSIQDQALQISADMARTRWLMSQQDDSSIPIAFLVVLIFWLSVLFSSFGLFSPRNATVVAMLFVCALSVAGAVFLIADLDQPFDGLIQISDAPLRKALSQLGQ